LFSAGRHGTQWARRDQLGADEPVVYADWDLQRPAIPSRSRLYALEPIGIGTPGTESLTSYVSRLAEVHSVRVRELMMHELLPFLGRPHLADAGNANLLTAFWRNETRALNGTRTLARNLVQALETLTGRRDLRFLTLVSWTEVLPIQQLQKHIRAWCPSCFTEWRESGRVVYDPLVWTFAPVTFCPQHGQRLRVVCPFPDCRRPSPWLSSRSRPGCCARCGRWLGNSGTYSPTEGETLAPDERIQAHLWTCHAIGELIESAPSLPEPPHREHLVRGMQRSLRSVAGSRRGWARQLGLAEGTVLEWRKGLTIPSLWCLLLVSSRLGISPLQLVCDQVGDVGQAAKGEAVPEARPDRPPQVRTTIDPAAVRGALEAILASDEVPPPSLREVAERIGQTYTTLRHHLPELSRVIAARYRSHQEAQGARTRAHLKAEVRQAAIYLHQQGYYPSSNRIAALLSRPNSFRSRTAQSARHDVLREIGWRT
jgi:endogenous inhibitor of DNA gyrase (YacG/DUF329 family)